jgi:hypothetical protein
MVAVIIVVGPFPVLIVAGVNGVNMPVPLVIEYIDTVLSLLLVTYT